jgi:GT2 family glycosyltransferase
VELRERDVDAISGAFMAVPTRLWSELNGFDECYPHSGEDVDLCFRAAQLNARVVFLPDAVATHARGVSVDQAPAEIDVLRWIGLIRLASKVEGPISALLIRATLALRATVVITLARLGMVRRSARDRERTRLLWKWCLSGSAPSLPATPTRTK